MADLTCVVSPHEKGFWQVDIYHEGWAEGLSPDWFCTGKLGGTKEEIIAQVKNEYPNVKIVQGLTGVCVDCGEEFYELEQKCNECGGVILVE